MTMTLIIIAFAQMLWALYMMRSWKLTQEEYEAEIEYLQKRIHALACDNDACKNGVDE